MALSTKSKQKKLAKKSSKRKAKLKEKNSTAHLSPKQKMEQKLNQAKTAPIHQCYVPEDLFEKGIGNLVITRLLSPTRIGLAVFFVDVWAQGVVDCFYEEMSLITFEDQLKELNRQISPMQPVEPAYIKKLIVEAQDFAQLHDFVPHPLYRSLTAIFHDVDTLLCNETFEFGKDGLPYVVKRGCHDPHCGHDH